LCTIFLMEKVPNLQSHFLMKETCWENLISNINLVIGNLIFGKEVGFVESNLNNK